MDPATELYFDEPEHCDEWLIPLLNFIPAEIFHLVFPPKSPEEWTAIPGGWQKKRHEGAP